MGKRLLKTKNDQKQQEFSPSMLFWGASLRDDPYPSVAQINFTHTVKPIYLNLHDLKLKK
jgi:hypothetical protein